MLHGFEFLPLATLAHCLDQAGRQKYFYIKTKG